MKVWPWGKPRSRRMWGQRRGRPRVHGHADVSDWVPREEKRLVESRFGGDWNRYAAWRDRHWIEVRDTMRRPDAAARPADGDEYVVMTAFDGDWARYRICRDRLREELWQIMKVRRSAETGGCPGDCRAAGVIPPIPGRAAFG